MARKPATSERPSTRRRVTAPEVKAHFPPKLEFLFKPSRYKVIHGGRGGGKSWAIARALLIIGYRDPIRVLCARELQNSISDSVHKLLSDQVLALGLEDFYRIEKATISGLNGTEFRFAGIKTNIGAVKSFEGITHVWCEEAANISKASWETLIPTVRRDASEIWVSFNPELETDETYKRFVLNPPPNAVVVKQGWEDNPWFPEVLRIEKDHLQERDADAYLNIWEGHCRQMLDGAVYASELRSATAEGRICRVPWEQSKPVNTFFDLGRRDMTSIWFVQVVGFEFRLIDFYENSGFVLTHYLKVLQEKPYVYGEHWLPHDATHELLASSMTIEQQMRAQGFKVRITPKVTLTDGINAARTVFGKCWFDADKCADGVQSLRHYRYEMEIDAVTRKREPLHDINSHASDAFRYMAVALNAKAAASRSGPSTVTPLRLRPDGGNVAWMGG